MSQTNDWHSTEPKFVPMSVDDAHGTALLSQIQQAMGNSQSIIAGINAHAPLVASQLAMLDHHYMQLFMLVEQAMRARQERPEEELVQFDILNEFNTATRSNSGDSRNVITTLYNRLMPYGAYAPARNYGNGGLPRQVVMTEAGQLNLRCWTAAKVGNEITITEYLEAPRPGEDAKYRVTHVLSDVALPPLALKQTDFVELVSTIYNREVTDKPAWLHNRICYTSKDLQGDDTRRAFGWNTRSVDDKVVREIDFNYDYPFSVEQLNHPHEAAGTAIRRALVVSTDENARYLFIFALHTTGAKHDKRLTLIYDRCEQQIVPCAERWEIEKELATHFELSQRGQVPIAGNDLILRSLSPNEAWPREIADREGIDSCYEVTFRKPQLVMGEKLFRLEKAYLYTVENMAKDAPALVQLTGQLVGDGLDLNDIFHPTRY